LWRGDNRTFFDPYSVAVETTGGATVVDWELTDASNNHAMLTAPISLGQFVHVAATYDQSTGLMTIYVNGALAAQQTTTISPFVNLIPADAPGIGIGNLVVPSTPFGYKGVIDELSVYSRALTASEVQSIYAAGSAGKCKPTSTLAMSPGAGLAGQKTTVNGTAFGPSETVDVYTDQVSGTPLAIGTTDATGVFTSTAKLPSTTYGQHALIAIGQTSGLRSATSIVVRPSLVATPTSGLPGSAVPVTGSGFGTTEKVTVYWDTTQDSLGVATANGLGRFQATSALTVTVPISAPPGQHLLVGIGQSTGAVAVSTFTVQ
jgi:hypothetical protein